MIAWRETKGVHGSIPSLHSLLGVPDGCGLEASPLVKIGRVRDKAGDFFEARLDAQEMAERCCLLFHQYVDKAATYLPSQLQDICHATPDDAWIESCSQERLEILE